MKNVLELKMEDIIRSPCEVLVKALSYLNLVDFSSSRIQRLTYRVAAQSGKHLPLSAGEKIPVEILRERIIRNRFSRMSNGREQGDEDVTSHYRKGVAGDWKNHFTAQHRRAFKERYNDLLVELGYEKSSDW